MSRMREPIMELEESMNKVSNFLLFLNRDDETQLVDNKIEVYE